MLKMWSKQQISQRHSRGSRWRGWFSAWQGVEHKCLHNAYFDPPKDPMVVKAVIDDEAGPIIRNEWQKQNPDLWYVKNCSINDFHVDYKKKNLWMDAVTYYWWLKFLPIQTKLPQNNWLFLIGSLYKRYHRYFLYQRARQQQWPILWSCIVAKRHEFHDVDLYYKRYRKNWWADLPLEPFDIHPTTYNPGITLDWADPNGQQNQLMPRYRSYTEFYENWPSYRLHIVAETTAKPLCWPNKTGAYLTEKSYRTISHGKPAVWLGSPGTVRYLQSEGYRTWGHLWDETYDQETDLGKRFRKVCQTLDQINSWSEEKWTAVWPDIVEIAIHNQANFKYQHQRSHENILKAKKIIFGF